MPCFWKNLIVAEQICNPEGTLPGLKNFIKFKLYSANPSVANSGIALLNESGLALNPATLVTSGGSAAISNAIVDGLSYNPANGTDMLDYSWSMSTADYLNIKSVKLRHNNYAWENRAVHMKIFESDAINIEGIWTEVKIYAVNLTQDTWFEIVL